MKKIFLATLILAAPQISQAGLFDKIKELKGDIEQSVENTQKELESYKNTTEEINKPVEDVVSTTTPSTQDNSKTKPKPKHENRTSSGQSVSSRTAAPKTVQQSGQSTSAETHLSSAKSGEQSSESAIETIAVTSPAPGKIRGMVLPAYKGEWLFNNHYVSVKQGELSPESTARMALKKEVRNVDVELLWDIADRDPSTFDKEKLKQEFCSTSCRRVQSVRFSDDDELIWHHSLLQARSLLTDEYQARYSDGVFLRADQFEMRKLYAEYIDEFADNFIELGRKLPQEAYVVGSVPIGKYNFDLEGYELRMDIMDFYGAPFDYRETQDKINKRKASGQAVGKKQSRLSGLTGGETYLYKIAPDQAEILSEQHRNMYFVYKVKVHPVSAEEKEAMRPSSLGSHVDSHIMKLAGGTVEVFYDADLKEKAFEFVAY